MAKTDITKLRHRAVCDDDSYKGPWRDDKKDARADAKAHRNKAGNEDHVIRIVSEQTTSKVFV